MSLNIPLFSTKTKNLNQKFDLSDPGQRQIYFRKKAGQEIEQIKTFLDNHTFVAIMLGKKGAGKGTCSGLLTEILGDDKVAQISVGDITRSVFKEIQSKKGLSSLKSYLAKNYRGYISINETIDIFLNKTQDKLFPTEFILSLVIREIEKMPKKALFIDGFPRNVDQISYSLYLRQIINFRNDPDFMVFIDVPESVIDARIKTRVICPKCQTSRNLSLNPSGKVGYDKKTSEYYLICNKPGCDGGKMIGKEGDSLGIKAIKNRLDLDGQLMDLAQNIHGLPKIFLRNSIPTNKTKKLFDEYEITPKFYYQKQKNGQIKTLQKPWIFKDDQGIDSISLMAPAVTISFLRQLAKILPLTKSP